MEPRPADVPQFVDLREMKSPWKVYWSGDGQHIVTFHDQPIGMVMKLETTQFTQESPLPVLRLEILCPNLEIVTKQQEKREPPAPVQVGSDQGQLVLEFLKKSAEEMDKKKEELRGQRQVCHEG